MSALKDFGVESKPTNFDWLAALLGSKSASDFKEFAGGGLKEDRKAVAADCLAYIEKHSDLPPLCKKVMVSVVMMHCGVKVDLIDMVRIDGMVASILRKRSPRLIKHSMHIRKIALYNALKPRAGKSSTEWVAELNLAVQKSTFCEFWYPVIDDLTHEFLNMITKAEGLISDYRNAMGRG